MSQPERKGMIPKGVGMAPCSLNYLKALVNPFGEFQDLPCAPCTPAVQTYRFRNVMRGTFSTGTLTTGSGGVGWAPFLPANDVSQANAGAPACWYTTSAYSSASATMPVAIPTTGVTTVTKAALPFPNAAFATSGNYLSARLVGCGLRVKNVTAPLYRQGTLYGCQLPKRSAATNMNRLLTGVSPAMGSSIEESTTQEGWRYLNWRPTDEDDIDFLDGAINHATSDHGNFCMAFWVQGASMTNPSTYIWEVVEFWEFYGQTTTYQLPSSTRTHSDPVGLSRALEAVSVPANSLGLPEYIRGASERVVDAMAHSDTVSKTIEDLLGLAGMAMPAIGTLVGGLSKALAL
jgi:hypothetical protein